MFTDWFDYFKSMNNKNLDMLIEWILSDEGQEVVEKTGYVPVK